MVRLTQLELLDLAYNNIYSMEEVDTLPSLRLLYLNGNPVSFAEGFPYDTLTSKMRHAWYDNDPPPWIEDPDYAVLSSLPLKQSLSNSMHQLSIIDSMHQLLIIKLIINH